MFDPYQVFSNLLIISTTWTVLAVLYGSFGENEHAAGRKSHVLHWVWTCGVALMLPLSICSAALYPRMLAGDDVLFYLSSLVIFARVALILSWAGIAFILVKPKSKSMSAPKGARSWAYATCSTLLALGIWGLIYRT